MSAEKTVKSSSVLSKKQICINRTKTQKLLDRSYIRGEHKALKKHMENNPLGQTFDRSLKYGIKLVTRKTRTMSEVAPTLITLLQNGAKWNRPGRLMKSRITPYHVICGSTGDHHELLSLMITVLGQRLVNAKDYQDCTALMYAVQNVNVKCVEILIASGADVNLMNNKFIFSTIPNVTDMMIAAVSPLIDSINMLHPSSQCSHDIMMDIFDIMLENGADVNQTSYEIRYTPIMYAAVVGNVNCVKKLIQKGAKVDCANRDGDLLCTLAARTGNVEMLKCLLEDNGIDKNSVDGEGLSVLRCAVNSRNIEAVRYLLDLGVKIPSYIPQECVASCKDCGTNLSWRDVDYDKRYSDPYMLAIRSNMSDVVRLMDQYGSQLYNAAEILNYAICERSVDVVDYLLSKYKYSLNYGYMEKCIRIKWSLDTSTSPHQTLLIDACNQNSVKLITVLLAHGADPNKTACPKKRPSAIHVAISNLHVEVIARFIRGGVDVNTRSYNRDMGMMLPFEISVCKNHIYAAEMLLVSGCSRGALSLDNIDNERIKVNIKPKMRKLLKEWNVHKNTVIPLQQRCRMMILNQLSPQADQKIIKLPLPPPLIKYLSIPELDDIVETFKCNPSRHYYVK